MDCGAESSLISLDLYKKMSPLTRPKLFSCAANMKGITGDPVAVYGFVDMTFEVPGKGSINQTCYVVDVAQNY